MIPNDVVMSGPPSPGPPPGSGGVDSGKDGMQRQRQQQQQQLQHHLSSNGHGRQNAGREDTEMAELGEDMMNFLDFNDPTFDFYDPSVQYQHEENHGISLDYNYNQNEPAPEYVNGKTTNGHAGQAAAFNYDFNPAYNGQHSGNNQINYEDSAAKMGHMETVFSSGAPSAAGSPGATAANRTLNSAFGKMYSKNPRDRCTVVPPPSPGLSEYLAEVDNAGPETRSMFSLQMNVAEFPARSRVETQIKCRLIIQPSPSQRLVKLPSDMIARPRLQLRDPFVPNGDTLSLDVDVCSTENPDVPLYMCKKCLSRERKRAFRKKNLDPNEEYHWNEERPRRLVMFNCREIIDLPEPRLSVGSSGGGMNDSTIESSELMLLMRITCYCRHHGAKNGFRIVFTLRDDNNNVVGRCATSPILITDDHKDSRAGGSISTASSSVAATPRLLPTSGAQSDVNLGLSVPPSPAASLDEVEDIATAAAAVLSNTASAASAKRRRSSGWTTNIRNSFSRRQSSGGVHKHSQSYQSLVSLHGLHAAQQPNRGGIEFMSPSSSESGLMFNVAPSAKLRGSVSLGGSLTPTGAITTTPSQSGHSVSSDDGSNAPFIERIIPSQGSVRGGIEITLLGSNFYPGLIAKFGDTTAVASHCWSESTMVTHLPPSAVPGPVIVTFEGINSPQSVSSPPPQIFTYVDDTDSQLIELALQVVGLKMNGKLEDARNIAMRIINPNTAGNDGSGSGVNGTHLDATTASPSMHARGNEELKPLSHEQIILRCVDLVLSSSDYSIPNWQLRNSEGQTMMHLAAALGYDEVVCVLITQGARVDLQDVSGMTPLHFAALMGQKNTVDRLISAHADPFMRTLAHQTVMDIASQSVHELLPFHMTHREYLTQLNHMKRASWEFESLSYSRSPGGMSAFVSANMFMFGQDDFYLPEHLEVSRDARRDGLSGQSCSSSSSLWQVLDDDSEAIPESDEEDEYSEHQEHEGVEATRGNSRSSSVSSSPAPQGSVPLSSSSSPSSPSNTNNKKNTNTNNNITTHITKALSRVYHVDWKAEVRNYINKPPYLLLERLPNEAIERCIPRRLRVVLPQSLLQGQNHERSGGSSSSPPAYEDIFPERSGTTGVKKDIERKQTEQQQQQQQPGQEKAAGSVQNEEELAQWYEQIFVQTWVNNRKTWRNDKMLFLFWIPVLLFALVIMAFRAYSSIWRELISLRSRRSSMRMS